MSEKTAQEFNSIPQKPLVVRWKLVDGMLPLAHRHYAALSQRGAGASLYAYVQTRTEQLLSGEFPLRHRNGVVVTKIEPDGEIDVVIEEMPEGPDETDTALLVNAAGAVIDAGDASAWIRTGRRIITPPVPPAAQRGTRSLVRDLTKTLKYDLVEEPLLPEVIESADEMFLVSDIFAVISVNDRGGELSQKIADSFAKLGL